jgi:hypothetical protein
MKNQVFSTFSALTLLTAAAAFGQSNAAWEADIPFAFHAGRTIFPAGHYEVRPERAQNVMLIRCLECKAAELVIVNPVEAGKAPETSSLVFHRYNGTYFLSKVWTCGWAEGRELGPSKAERELARNSSPGPSVVVAALVRR